MTARNLAGGGGQMLGCPPPILWMLSGMCVLGFPGQMIGYVIAITSPGGTASEDYNLCCRGEYKFYGLSGVGNLRFVRETIH